ncbi:MAG: class I SAM-dependent methyltransferase [Candidatus Coatesbacteria bacterium]|nr:class I SAM-dependent methyltransferase [Candidatus Coatesbacteria bacterium]
MAAEIPCPTSDKIGARVRRFYEEVPFPDVPLKRLSSLDELETRCGVYAKALNREIPDSARIIDVGCGTGQLACFLGQRPGRLIVGVDFSLASLEQGIQLASSIGLDNVHFIQADLFNLPFRGAAFDYALCHGVLHHTDDAPGGLAELGRVLEIGGFASIGLYNSWGRLQHRMRRAIRRMTHGKKDVAPKEFYRKDAASAESGTLASWFRDQFEHPHEAPLSIGRAEIWSAWAGLHPFRVLPGPFSRGLGNGARLFPPGNSGPQFGRSIRNLVSQSVWAIKPRESGYFILICKKGQPR